MSIIEKIFLKVENLNKKAREKGFDSEEFIMVQSDGVTISFYGYFFETHTRKIKEDEDIINKDLDVIEYFLDGFKLM
jgi:hypothetical protein